MTELSGREYETLWCLFYHGPTWDGDIPSKCGRDDLVERNWAFRYDGWQALTPEGLTAAIELGMDRKKDKVQTLRRAGT